jgi:hypothetical protein
MAAIVTAAPVKTGPACRDDDGQPLHGYGLGPVPLFMCVGELGELAAGRWRPVPVGTDSAPLLLDTPRCDIGPYSPESAAIPSTVAGSG